MKKKQLKTWQKTRKKTGKIGQYALYAEKSLMI